MSNPQPVPATQTSTPAPTPTATTITIAGTATTSTTVVTSTVVVTATTTTIVTRTATATVTTTTVVTVAVSAPVPAPPLASEIAQQTLQQVMESERTELVKEIDDLINQLTQRRASIGTPRDALEARALANLDADIKRLQQIRDSALKAKTPDELKSLRQELESIKSRYATSIAQPTTVNIDYTFYTVPDYAVSVPQQEQPVSSPTHTTTTTLPGVLKAGDASIPLVEKRVTFTYDVQQTGDGYSVKGKNIDYYANISKDSITIGNSRESQTLSKNDVAKMFIQFMLSSSVYTRERWQQLYSLIGGDKFRDVLRKWLNGESLTPDEVAYLADRVKNLANLRFMYDFSTLKQADPNLAMTMYDTAWGSLPLSERVQYNLTHLFKPQTVDERYSDVINMLVDRFRRGELNTPPGEGKWRFEEIAQKIAQYSPLNWVYNQIYSALYPYMGQGASTVAGAAVGALLSLIPLVGAGIAGATGAGIGATVATGLGIEALGAGLAGFAGLASKLTDPEARKAFIDWLNSNWALLAMETAGAIAGGYLGAKAVEKLPTDILTKPSIWNRLPDNVRQNFINAGIIQNVPGFKGTVAEVKIVETPAGKFQLKRVYDPNTKSITITLSSEGGANIAEINLPKEITEEVFTLLEKRGVTGEADKISFITDRTAMLVKASFVGEESKEVVLQRVQNFFNNVASLVRKGDAGAYQLVKDIVEGDIAGNVVIGADSSRIAFLDKARNVLYYGTSERQLMRIDTAGEKTSQIIENAIIRNDLAKIGNIVERVVSEAGVGRQIYIDTASGVGTYANILNIRLSPVEPGEANYITWQLQRLANLIRLNMAFRQQALTGGVPSTQLASMYGFDPAFLSRPEVMQLAQDIARLASGGVDFGLIFIPSANTLNIGVVAFAPSPQALSQSIAKAVEQGLKPESAGLRAIPIHRQVIETAVATRTVETAFNITRTIFTNVAETARLSEQAIHRTVTEPALLTRTADFISTKTVTQPTAITRTQQLTEKPVHRVEIAPYVATKTVEAVATAVRTVSTGTIETRLLSEKPIYRTEMVPAIDTRIVEAVVPAILTQPTAITMTKSLAEKPVHRVETVPMLVTKTVEVVTPQLVVQPTALSKQVALIESVIHRTATEPFSVVSSTTIVVVTTSIVVVPVTGIGTVSIVTMPVVITYTYTIPVTIATAVPAPAPPATPPPETGTETVAPTPTSPKLPGIEGLALIPTPAKPEQKPKLEKEVLVI